MRPSRYTVFMPNISDGPCLYCDGFSEGHPEELLKCDLCRRSVHFSCLKSEEPKQRLLGDNFFNFTCVQCDPGGCEQLKRALMSNLQFSLVAMYNLNMRASRTEPRFYHYKNEVFSFIKKHHFQIFSFDENKFYRDKKKLTYGGLSGLMASSPAFVAKDSSGRGGIYRLVELASPASLIRDYLVADRSSHSKKRSHDDDEPPMVSESKAVKTLDEELENSNSFMGFENIKTEPESCESSSESDDQQSSGSWAVNRTRNYGQAMRDVGQSSHSDCEEIEVDVNESESSEFSVKKEKEDFDVESESGSKQTMCSSLKIEEDDDKEEEVEIDVVSRPCPKKSLFTHSASVKMEDQQNENETDQRAVPLSLYEEMELLNMIDSLSGRTPELHRLLRKLKLRRVQREHSVPVLDLEAEMRFLTSNGRLMTSKDRKSVNSEMFGTHGHTSRVLDRYQVRRKNHHLKREFESFKARLTGSRSGSRGLIHSPYTLRRVKPYIFRDFSTVPSKVKLLQDICLKATEKDGSDVSKTSPYVRKPIDYCYVTPKYIPAMNYLAQQFFWPGIELSDVLNYPDFTCVVLYGELVIGFGVIVPDAKFNEAYISFLVVHPEWRNYGIGKFILYHLIQTCQGKDITLHVSATNSALILYQAFGFKVEEFLANFYDKYLPENSDQCKHAMFMRLRR